MSHRAPLHSRCTVRAPDFRHAGDFTPRYHQARIGRLWSVLGKWLDASSWRPHEALRSSSATGPTISNGACDLGRPGRVLHAVGTNASSGTTLATEIQGGVDYWPVEKFVPSPGTRLSHDLRVAKPSCRCTTASVSRPDGRQNRLAWVAVGHLVSCESHAADSARVFQRTASRQRVFLREGLCRER